MVNREYIQLIFPFLTKINVDIELTDVDSFFENCK